MGELSANKEETAVVGTAPLLPFSAVLPPSGPGPARPTCGPSPVFTSYILPHLTLSRQQEVTSMVYCCDGSSPGLSEGYLQNILRLFRRPRWRRTQQGLQVKPAAAGQDAVWQKRPAARVRLLYPAGQRTEHKAGKLHPSLLCLVGNFPKFPPLKQLILSMLFKLGKRQSAKTLRGGGKNEDQAVAARRHSFTTEPRRRERA